jgi:AcrR family transcriptional regulator
MHNDGKKKIIEAAQRLIASQGVEKTSMRDIAEEAGITTGAIYYYYKSKEALLYDVMDYAMAITTNIMEQRKGNPPPAQLLDEIARQMTKRIQDGPNSRLRFYLAYQAALGDETLRQNFAKDYAAQADRTAALFDYVFGMDPHPEDRDLAILMIAALDGLNLQEFIGALPVENAEIARVFNEFFAFAVPEFSKLRGKHNLFDHLDGESKTK